MPQSKTTIAAWSQPKAKRRRLINSLLQINCNFIFCFRAKEKLKIVPGKDPQQLGFMPIAGEEFVYELTASALLLPNANGFPTWNPIEAGERLMVKLPEQFKELYAGDSWQLNEHAGEVMARWAAGVKPVDQTAIALLTNNYALVKDATEFAEFRDHAQRMVVTIV